MRDVCGESKGTKEGQMDLFLVDTILIKKYPILAKAKIGAS